MQISRTEAHRFIEVMQNIICDELKQDGSLLLQGFGSFTPWRQTERQGRNPRTGKACMIQPRTSVKFRPGKSLLAELNQEEQ